MTETIETNQTETIETNEDETGLGTEAIQTNLNKAGLGHEDFKRMFDLYRHQIEHEDTLTSQRITYSGVIQVALVATLAGEFQTLFPNLTNPHHLVAQAGIFVSVYTLIGVLAAQYASHSLSKQADQVLESWKEWAEQNSDPLKSLIPTRPNGGGSFWAHVVGSIFGSFAFIILFAIWIFLLTR